MANTVQKTFRKKKEHQLIPKNAGKHQETQDIEDANQMLLRASCESLGPAPKLGTDEAQSHIHPEQSSWRSLTKLLCRQRDFSAGGEDTGTFVSH